MSAEEKLGRVLVVASHNEGKVREIRDLLAPFGIETKSAAELDLDEPEETFRESAQSAYVLIAANSLTSR